MLYDGNGNFAGYVMPFVGDAVPIVDIYNPTLRAQKLPGMNRFYLHRMARNLAAAVEAVHDCGYVIGDLNESNILVTNTALVTIIDTDSFQVQDWLCPVGKPDYTPPELQGKHLRTERRSRAHDHFGLGVLLFQILMGGNHPFRGNWQGTGDSPQVPTRSSRGCSHMTRDTKTSSHRHRMSH